MATPDQIRAENKQTVLTYYRLLMEKDIPAWSELWADDGKQENPFAPDGILEVFPDKAFLVSWYQKIFKNRKEHVFTLDAIHETMDPDVIIVEARARSIVGEIDRVYEQRYVMVFKFRDGKLILNREYFNPLAYLKAWDGVTVNVAPTTSSAAPAGPVQ